MFDLVVGASSIYGGSWLEGAGAVYAENQALRWIADLAGLPGRGRRRVRAGRHHRQPLGARRRPAHRPDASAARRAATGAGARPWRVAATHGGALLDRVGLPGDGRRVGRGRRRREWPAHRRPALREVLLANGPGDVLRRGRHQRHDQLRHRRRPRLGRRGVPRVRHLVPRRRRLWRRRAGRALGAPPATPGIEHCDSFIVDPHKWLFAPFDCCALLYREPALARAAHTQHASYLDVLTDAPDWNPTDYAVGLTRRARGLPFWFSLATHGTRRLPRRRRADAGGDPVRRRRRSGAATTSRSCASPTCRSWSSGGSAGRAAAVPGVVRPAARRPVRLRGADLARRRDADPVRHRQPAAPPRTTSRAILDTMA